MQCSECRHYKKDVEYKGLGSCENQEVTGRLIFGNADYFLIADDFGCLFAEGTEQQLQPENVLPVCWNENCPKWSEDICQSPGKCIEDVSG